MIRMTDYVIVRAGKVVQSIAAENATLAQALRLEAGALYVKCGDAERVR